MLGLLIEIDNVNFAIPFRTSMSRNHKYNFTTELYIDSKSNKKRKGLDYQKAVPVKKIDINYIEEYTLPLNEYIKISKSENKIIKDFTKMLEKYKLAIKTNDKNILKDFKYSSLQYFHIELGIEVAEVMH